MIAQDLTRGRSSRTVRESAAIVVRAGTMPDADACLISKAMNERPDNRIIEAGLFCCR